MGIEVGGILGVIILILDIIAIATVVNSSARLSLKHDQVYYSVQG